MKSNLFLVITGIMLLSLSFASAVDMGLECHNPPVTTKVHGIVSCFDAPMKYATVIVECYDDDSKAFRFDITNKSGGYLVSFPESRCDIGDMVIVTATNQTIKKKGVTKSVTEDVDERVMNIDVELCQEDNEVPEFSAIAAGVALIGSGIGFIALRRRKK